MSAECADKTLSVILKVIYIFEGDQYKKYEIRLKPDEYFFVDIMAKIKEKVQHDRFFVKSNKRCFLLVDLFENT